MLFFSCTFLCPKVSKPCRTITRHTTSTAISCQPAVNAARNQRSLLVIRCRTQLAFSTYIRAYVLVKLQSLWPIHILVADLRDAAATALRYTVTLLALFVVTVFLIVLRGIPFTFYSVFDSTNVKLLVASIEPLCCRVPVNSSGSFGQPIAFTKPFPSTAAQSG